MQIDATNRRILALLSRDARIGASAIGRAIGLSRPAVQQRIRTMEDSGIIRGYHAEIAPEAAPAEALISVRITTRPCDPALRWLAAQEGVTSVLSLSGEPDALVQVSLPDMAALSALTDRIAAFPLIAGTTSHVILRRYSATC